MTNQRLRIDLSYNGKHFHGWAMQPGQRTVEGVLGEWLTRITQSPSPVRLIVAGRTDSGVHARGQVAHVDLPTRFTPAELKEHLDRVMPPDIVIRRLSIAPPGFDARFAAIWRRYVYRLWDADSKPDPLVGGMVTRVHYPLDLDLMNRAGQHLLGLHDFAPFCKHRDGATTIRTLQICHAQRVADGHGTIELTVRADAFCRSMVRALTGALVAVARGTEPLEWIDEVAASPRRHGKATTMPPQGLCLEQVAYAPDAELAQRAGEARAMRTLDVGGSTMDDDCGCGFE
jgi:tRNA pseudouridine38-40 synthase